MMRLQIFSFLFFKILFCFSMNWDPLHVTATLISRANKIIMDDKTLPQEIYIEFQPSWVGMMVLN